MNSVFADGHNTCGQCARRKTFNSETSVAPGEIDLVDGLPGWRLRWRLQVGSVVSFHDQKFMIVDCENLAHALPTIDGVQYIDIFLGLARQEIDLEDPVVQTKTIGRPRVEAVVLKQGVLHDPEKRPAVGADRQALHAAIGLASGRVAQQLGVRVGARVGDEKLGRHGDATQQVTLRVELKNIGTILIRDVEGSVRPDANPLRIKPQGGKFVVRVKGSSRADKSLTEFVLEQARVQQHGVWMFGNGAFKSVVMCRK